MNARSWVEVSAPNLRHNLNAIRSRLAGDTAIMPVVKANAYGHGLLEVASVLEEQDIAGLAVAQPAEGLELRRVFNNREILVMQGWTASELDALIEHRLTATVHEARPLPPGLTAQVKVDTGMTRMGIPWKQVPSFLSRLSGRVKGVYSHLARADTDADFSRLQVQRFRQATEGIRTPRHIANSAGVLLPEAHFDLVRVGLAVYGIAPCPGFEDLRPVLSWKSSLVAIRSVPAAAWIGYGASFQTRRKSTIGVLPVGYADGYRRAFSNRAEIRIQEREAPVVGRVSMDLTCVDLTGIEAIHPETEVELLSRDPQSPLSCRALAELADTIPYEILTGIGPRIERRVIDN